MEDKKYIENIIVVLILVISIYFQFQKTSTTESMIIFAIIVVIIVLYFTSSYIKGKLSKIDKVNEHLLDLEKKRDYQKELHQIDKRVSILEEIAKMKKIGKKGTVDPQTLIVILLIILLILYLRSIGIIQF
ncbi:MAG: hypothetical protein U9P44_01930 [archaeon]|nr:hypothetical protein [archaeon]